ncbi:hypothetical protein Q4603_21565 [Zobellia galactanivorans]|uniref:hypothetical protein n=1 Tax=Zobellia galactanivorans (strain DSM 12802 / CCUG 47099 / CIP 106680 / NCIMB 13871 / Dsij) TaxID=63186 RepID=UPI0026E37907|nr:hypothetical protein [Zobellia galactanivorans]MDO6811220.1 hypothetical protein [Zobellia galactanivorans]
MKTDEIDFSTYHELHAHKGSENYEVKEIIPKQNEASYFELDTIQGKVFVNSFFEPKSTNKDGIEYNTLRLDLLGNTLDSTEAHSKLKDGTLWNSNYYISWLINSDTTKHKYLDPFSNTEIEDIYDFKPKETDPEKWLEKFKEFYNRASYVYETSWDYYFKINKKWYLIKYNLDVVDDDFVKNHPPKEDQDVRMVELENLAPVWYHKGFKDRDTSLIKMVDYESTYFEKVDQGLNQYGFSAGWWYLEIPMPLGDTIRIKRYSNYEDPELLIYKVPGEYGGREDVLFIVQKPEELFPGQVGGMYAIRPRDMGQPQRRYKKIVYTTDAEGNETIDRSRSVETDEYKQWTNNKG